MQIYVYLEFARLRYSSSQAPVGQGPTETAVQSLALCPNSAACSACHAHTPVPFRRASFRTPSLLKRSLGLSLLTSLYLHAHFTQYTSLPFEPQPGRQIAPFWSRWNHIRNTSKGVCEVTAELSGLEHE